MSDAKAIEVRNDDHAEAMRLYSVLWAIDSIAAERLHERRYPPGEAAALKALEGIRRIANEAMQASDARQT